MLAVHDRIRWECGQLPGSDLRIDALHTIAERLASMMIESWPPPCSPAPQRFPRRSCQPSGPDGRVRLRDVIRAVLGLVVFAGLTMYDFQRLRRSRGLDSAPTMAASILLDVLNVLLYFLSLFDRRRRAAGTRGGDIHVGTRASRVGGPTHGSGRTVRPVATCGNITCIRPPCVLGRRQRCRWADHAQCARDRAVWRHLPVPRRMPARLLVAPVRCGPGAHPGES